MSDGQSTAMRYIIDAPTDIAPAVFLQPLPTEATTNRGDKLLGWAADGLTLVNVSAGGGGGATEINDLTDVDTTGLATDDGLMFDGDNFVPQAFVTIDTAQTITGAKQFDANIGFERAPLVTADIVSVSTRNRALSKNKAGDCVIYLNSTDGEAAKVQAISGGITLAVEASTNSDEYGFTVTGVVGGPHKFQFTAAESRWVTPNDIQVGGSYFVGVDPLATTHLADITTQVLAVAAMSTISLNAGHKIECEVTADLTINFTAGDLQDPSTGYIHLHNDSAVTARTLTWGAQVIEDTTTALPTSLPASTSMLFSVAQVGENATDYAVVTKVAEWLTK